MFSERQVTGLVANILSDDGERATDVILRGDGAFVSSSTRREFVFDAANAVITTRNNVTGGIARRGHGRMSRAAGWSVATLNPRRMYVGVADFIRYSPTSAAWPEDVREAMVARSVAYYGIDA